MSIIVNKQAYKANIISEKYRFFANNKLLASNLLSETDEKHTLLKTKSSDLAVAKQNKDKIFNSYFKLIFKLTKDTFIRSSECIEFDDLLSSASCGLLKAIDETSSS